jgi:hypothetical protein
MDKKGEILILTSDVPILWIPHDSMKRHITHATIGRIAYRPNAQHGAAG